MIYLDPHIPEHPGERCRVWKPWPTTPDVAAVRETITAMLDDLNGVRPYPHRRTDIG